MKILVIDTCSNALDFLMRCQRYGHEVMWWNKMRKDGTERRAGEGIVPLLRDYEALRKKWIGWADLIYVPDNTAYLDLLEPYRRMGYPIYGTNKASTEWETDRAAGQAIMKKAGMAIIPGKEFNDHDAAIAHVLKEGRAFVSKPSGEADKAQTYVSDSAADLVYMLRRWQENPKYVAAAKADGFILQEKKTGCEMGAGGWFGPNGWASYWEESFEYKKLMDGDLGVNTGEQGTLIRFVRQSKLADQVLKPLAKALKAVEYVGCVNVNCIIDDKGQPWPLEFTMRDGWPATHNHASLHLGDPAQWMLDLINGKDTREVQLDTCSISVVMSIPDYPYSHLTSKEVCGIPIYGATDREHVHLSEVMLGEEVPVQVGDKVVEMPCYVTAGDYVLVVTGTGETITGARRSAYAAVDKIKIPNSPSYRLDIGRSKLVTNLARIQKHGYANGLTY